MKLFYPALTLLLFVGTSMAQEPVIPCSVTEGKSDTTLKCREDGETFRVVFPKTVYRFIDCETVNLQRGADGKRRFAAEQSCHIIDSALMIEACGEWQESELSQWGYDLGRSLSGNNLPFNLVVDCEHWWTHVEGEQALVNVYQMRPLEPKRKR